MRCRAFTGSRASPTLVVFAPLTGSTHTLAVGTLLPQVIGMPLWAMGFARIVIGLVIDRIDSVRRACIPAEITEGFIAAIKILVAALHTFRTGADEGFQD